MNPTSIEVTEFHYFVSLIREQLPSHEVGELMTAEQLIPEPLWEAYPDLHTVFGRYLSFAVTLGLLPLVHTGFNSQRHNVYEVTKSCRK
jgi:hypothetical protein